MNEINTIEETKELVIDIILDNSNFTICEIFGTILIYLSERVNKNILESRSFYRLIKNILDVFVEEKFFVLEDDYYINMILTDETVNTAYETVDARMKGTRVKKNNNF